MVFAKMDCKDSPACNSDIAIGREAGVTFLLVLFWLVIALKLLNKVSMVHHLSLKVW